MTSPRNIYCAASLMAVRKKKSKTATRSSSKRQQNANITFDAVKYNVRAFPNAADLIERTGAFASFLAPPPVTRRINGVLSYLCALTG